MIGKPLWFIPVKILNVSLTIQRDTILRSLDSYNSLRISNKYSMETNNRSRSRMSLRSSTKQLKQKWLRKIKSKLKNPKKKKKKSRRKRRRTIRRRREKIKAIQGKQLIMKCRANWRISWIIFHLTSNELNYGMLTIHLSKKSFLTGFMM